MYLCIAPLSRFYYPETRRFINAFYYYYYYYNALIDDEISALIGKASGSFGKLTKRLWSERSVRLAIKQCVLCGCAINTDVWV